MHFKRHLVLVFLAFAITSSAKAQTYVRITGIVRDTVSHEEVAGARIKIVRDDSTIVGAIADRDGNFHLQVPSGEYDIVVTSTGYQPYKHGADLDETDSARFEIALFPLTHSSAEIVVSGTRSERSIDNTPVRVELVSQEDLEEKIMEKPTSVIELLNESAGTRIQSTSPSSNAANIRIQGLQGRYTQVLVDGIPSYSGLASSFGLTQLQPLNLKRVEIVKGASSATYGPDAIAGIINFITKDPAETPEINGVLNTASTKAYDASAFYARKFGEFGATLLASYNKQQMVDIDHDGLADIPSSDRISVTPKLNYEIANGITGSTTLTYMEEQRLGGSMNANDDLIGRSRPWSESDKSKRFDIATTLNTKVTDSSSATIRAAAMHLDRTSYFGASPFDGAQDFRLVDAQYEFSLSIAKMQFGVAFQQDRFTDKTPNITLDRNYLYNDAGQWLQADIAVAEPLEFLASGRLDEHTLGTFFTPRASLMYRPNGIMTFRIGAGTGFKAPTPFLEEVELYGYQNLRPFLNVQAERAQSASFDADLHGALGDISVKADMALFATNLDHALLLDDDSLKQNILFVRNASGSTLSRGAELTMMLSLEDLLFSVSYVYLDTKQNDEGHSHPLDLNPKHWFGTSLSYEEEDDGWKAGIEAYYIGEQQLEHDPYRTVSPSYWLAGVLLEKAWGTIHLFLNCENMFDVRQTRYEPIFQTDPITSNIRPLPEWAPAEGRVINGGIRIVMH